MKLAFVAAAVGGLELLERQCADPLQRSSSSRRCVRIISGPSVYRSDAVFSERGEGRPNRLLVGQRLRQQVVRGRQIFGAPCRRHATAASAPAPPAARMPWPIRSGRRYSTTSPSSSPPVSSSPTWIVTPSRGRAGRLDHRRDRGVGRRPPGRGPAMSTPTTPWSAPADRLLDDDLVGVRRRCGPSSGSARPLTCAPRCRGGRAHGWRR